MSEELKPEIMEMLAEAVHKSYCKCYQKREGKEYWTKGDYTCLDEETKQIDRETVKAVIAAMPSPWIPITPETLKELDEDSEVVWKNFNTNVDPMHDGCNQIGTKGEYANVNGYIFTHYMPIPEEN